MTQLVFLSALLLSILLPASAWAPLTASYSRQNHLSATGNDDSPSATSLMRRNVLASASSIFVSLAISATSSKAAEETTSPNIAACATTASTDGSSTSTNCVSTASVRNIDFYMVPWTYPDTMSTPEVLARLKGLIQSDSTMTLESIGETYVSATASRNLGTCVDQLDFVIRPDDHVITFQSKQIQGSATTSDFGANRNRLEALRQKAGGIFGRMGEGLETADTSVREGVAGQLKAFWGLQSGAGYEDVILE
ncbi:hypothetical protein MPSEU_000531600 [Mayamaea pseudoterrestris]|nr:hypothetical protein MPSEU_000531600 [Mayamaea pseudoterrestris]